MVKMKPGIPPTRRQRRLLIQVNRPTQNATTGGQTDAWVTIASVWSIDWRTVNGHEYMIGEQRRADTTVMVTIRYNPSLATTPRMRLATTDLKRVFDVNSVLDVNEQHQYLQLFLKEAE